ncbi:MAG TPA: hypothetical protein VGC21_05090 [Telluria sp.]
MDEKNHSDIHQEMIGAVFDIVTEATLAKVTLPQSSLPDRPLRRLAKWIEAKGKLVFTGVLIAETVMLISAAAAYFTRNPVLLTVSKVSSAVAILLWFAYMVMVIIVGFPTVIDVVRAPYQPLLASVRHALEYDRQYYDRLKLLDIKALKHVLAYYKNERVLMERRGALLSGSIDRIGLFPAFGAVALLYLGLQNIVGDNGWAEILVPIIAIFHFMNFLAFGMYQKVDRIITMLEVSIDLHDEDAMKALPALEPAAD